MVFFPNCKINLGLNIVAKRDDGYHGLETVFYPVFLCDVLEVIPLPQKEKCLAPVDFSYSGMKIGGVAEHNLCIKAYHLLKKDFPDLPDIKVHLHKVIPMGAGLGGGSADGSFMLKILNEQFQLGLSSEQLMMYALQLGSDCPFFIINKPCYATGRGEQMKPIDLNFSDYKFVLINPRIHVSTHSAFSALTPKKSINPITTIIRQPIETWKDVLVNDFEEPVSALHPEIATIKQMLYSSGAVYAAMSGSGSTVFGIFKKQEVIRLKLPPEYFYWSEQVN